MSLAQRMHFLQDVFQITAIAFVSEINYYHINGINLFWWFGLVSLAGFYGISTFVGYSMPNPFLRKYSILFQTIQFSISTQFNCQKHFYFKLFKQLSVTIQLSENTALISKNSSISNSPVKHKHVV